MIAFYKSIRFTQLNRDPNILIQQSEEKTSIVSIYVNNFLLASNTMVIFDALKESLAQEYNTKDLGQAKTIIKWQINRDVAMSTIKID